MITKKDLKFFEIAKSLSFLSSGFSRGRVGAVIVLKNEVIATGYNKRKSHPMQLRFAKMVGKHDSMWLHAEMSCLIKLVGRDLSDAKIYVYRHVLKTFKRADARPCKICLPALLAFGIREINYTITDGYRKEFI